MGSIPLPALSARNDAPSPLQTYTTIAQLMGARQEQQLTQQRIQQGQIQLNDQQAMSAAMHQWDGKDPAELPGLVLKAGGSANAVFGLKNQILDYKTKAATLTKDQVDNQNSINDIIDGHLESVKSAPAEQKQQAWDAATSDLVNRGYIQPGQFRPQYPGDDQIDLIEKQHMGQKAIFDQAQKERATKAQETEAGARALSAQTASQELQARLPGGPLNAVTQHVQEETNPAVIAAHGQIAAAGATAAEKAREALNPSALVGVAPNLVAPATSAATKAGSDYNQAQQAADDLQSMVGLAKGGNKVAYAYSPVSGVLQINVAGQTKRMNMAEIEQYGGAGSALDRIKGFLGKQVSGASIPENILDDMSTVSGMYAKNAEAKYERDLATINQNYGSKFTPIKNQTQHSPGNQATGMKEGQTGTGSDGKKYVVKNGIWVAQQ